MKIYICGKISGEPYNSASKKFKEAEKKLQKYYPEAEIINPIEHCKQIASKYRISEEIFNDWQWCMTVDFAELLTCTHIFLLPDWRDSKGACIEVAVAKELGLAAIGIND